MKEKTCQLDEFCWLVLRSLVSQRLVLLTRRKKGKIMLPVCLLSAVWPQTPTTQATLYQRPDCWKRFLVLLVKDVIKPPGTYFNNWLQLSCRSSKFSSPFPATSVLLYAPLDPVREPAKCHSQNRSSVPPKILSLNWLFEKWIGQCKTQTADQG